MVQRDHLVGRAGDDRQPTAAPAGVGSLLLLPEVLGKPLRDGSTTEVRLLAGLLARLDLRPLDRATADRATALSVSYRLRAADAAHLATAVLVRVDRFITTNQRDFPPTVSEVQVTYRPTCLRVATRRRSSGWPTP